MTHDGPNVAKPAFLRTLRELGYTGPIGLQCYGTGGDAREHLVRSLNGWRRLNRGLTEVT